MRAQGNQAAPKNAKLMPNDTQSLPKVAQSHPKMRTVLQSDPQSGAKIAPNGIKNGARIQNDFGNDTWNESLQF